MYSLHAFADPGQVDEAVAALQTQADVRHVIAGGITADTGKTLIRAEIGAESVDDTFAALQRIGIAAADLSVSRIDFARPMTADGVVEDAVDDQDSLVWAEVADAAAENVSLRPSYLAYMIVAGVVAAFGVTERSTILIVGAMAVSPDLLPMSAACVALVARRPRLLGRAFGTLAPGLALAVLAAYLLTLALRLAGQVSPQMDIQQGVIGALATVNVATVGVALAAGVAGMLAFETRASFVVGVAISVTTIPAAAYIGVAAGLGQWSGALGALTVLLVNLAMLLLAGTVTLAVQALRERARGHRALPREAGHRPDREARQGRRPSL
jgi:uncharacterized hydrophobic protein (TIGR00271 family)